MEGRGGEKGTGEEGEREREGGSRKREGRRKMG
jgi:hypothetical protein